MKTIGLVLLAAVLIGCHASGPSYAGGDGSSTAQAVVIKGVKTEQDGAAAERAWLEQKYPGFKMGKPTLLNSGGRHYEQIEITTAEGNQSVYFDITEYFGKW